MYILNLYLTYPDIVCEFASQGLFAVYGYWKDYIQIWNMINENSMSHQERYDTYNNLILALQEGILNQRRIDIETLRTFCKNHDFDFLILVLSKNSMNSLVSIILIRLSHLSANIVFVKTHIIIRNVTGIVVHQRKNLTFRLCVGLF